MVSQEIEQAFEVLKQADKEYIKKIIENNKHQLDYDSEYCGWLIGEKTVSDFLYQEENTYLNPKEIESVIDETIEEVMEEKLIKEYAEDFISYYEAKWGLDNLRKSEISSHIISDCEFHIFADYGLYDEVIKQLEEKGVKLND